MEDRVRFLLESFQLIEQTLGNAEQVYAFWQKNIDLIDASLIQILPVKASQYLKAAVAQEQRFAISMDILIFGTLIQLFPLGNQKINIELAITCFQIFITTITRNDYPIGWANIQQSLGNVYQKRIEGDHEANIELAIQAYQAALEVYTGLECPMLLASNQHNLGGAYMNRIAGDRKDNIELAIQILQSALEVRTRHEFPIEWAQTQTILGGAYHDRIEGDRRANIELAIQAYKAALEVRTHCDLPIEWANTINSLGLAYRDRIEGDRRANIELAIQALQAALEECTRPDSPVMWATIQHNLGAAYYDRIEGDRRANIELAIQAYKAALEVRTRRDFPVKWATIQHNLGAAYYGRIEGDRRANIELAIQAFQTALEVRTRRNFPVDWATTQNSLGLAYRDRIEGDRRANIELAIQALQAALEECTRPNFPVMWATIQHNLGAAYYDRIEGDRRANIELAIQAFQTALEVRTRRDFPVEWAMTQHNLGAAYCNRIEGDRKDNIELAIQASQAALEVYTRHNFPVEWAMTQNVLGLAYQYRIEGDHKANIELAIQAFQTALEVRTRRDFPVKWATTQHNLGAAYYDRIEGDHKANIELAIQSYKAALEVRQSQLLPLDSLMTGRNLGDIAFLEGDWGLAIEGFEKAITAVEVSRNWAMSERRRQEILDDSIDIYENMLQSCINADRLDLALQTIERVRSKKLADLMAAPNLSPQDEIPEPVKEILDCIAYVQQQMDDLRTFAPTNTPELVDTGPRNRAAMAPLTAEIQALEAVKQALLDILSRDDAVSAQLVEINPPDLSQIQSELLDRPDVALLSFYTTTQDTHILIVRSDSIQCFTCPGLGLEQLQRWLLNEWVLPYTQDQTSWQHNMPERLQQLAEKLELDRLVIEHLQDVRELILIPHLYLHLIPFAALPLNRNQQYLGDRFLLRYAPGCQVLKFCTDRSPLSSQQYGTIENATEDLPFAEIEGETIAQLFSIKDTDRLLGSEQVTVDKYKDLLGRVNSVASCHHAQSRLDNPLESALILANGRRITLGDLLSPAWRFADLSDVFLSCCETGMTVPKSSTDELLTLGTGFLCAGARSVISSLWSVKDLSTAFLSQFYHQYRAQEQSRIVALQKAQKKLRCSTVEELKALLRTQQEQLEQCRKDALHQQQQSNPNSEAHQKWTSEKKRYGNLIDNIEGVIIGLEDLSEESLPFNHPFYWAPFTCQGLR
jgi:CHAT domain-containing protein